MSKKKKILIWCDSPTVSTGFGNVAKNLLRDAYKEFDIDILGINYRGKDRYDTKKWFIYSVDSKDPYGHRMLPEIISKAKPDLIMLFQDIFNLDLVLQSVTDAAPKTPVILYYPIDGFPVARAWQILLTGTNNNIKKHFIYSEFSEREIRKTFPDLETPLEILYHGVDFDVFHKLPDEEIKDVRKKLGWSNKFMVTTVNTFQPRKFIMGTLRSVALIRYGYKKCKCGNYYFNSESTCPLNGCGPDSVLETVTGKTDIGLYLHMDTVNQSMGPPQLRSSWLLSHAANAGWKDDAMQDNTTRALYTLPRGKTLTSSPFSEESMNKIYNASNVNITTTFGEGFGLNLVEASACGTTTIAPNNSAIPEILAGTGRLVNNCGYTTMGGDQGHTRPVVSIGGVVDALEAEYKLWLDNGKKKIINQAAIDNVRSRFQWDDKRKQLMDAFKKYA